MLSLKETDGPKKTDPVSTLAAMNAAMDSAVSPFGPDAAYIEEQLEMLNALGPDSHRELCWLTWARLCELALLCAGTCADHGELAAAGDLLVNPREVRIYVRHGTEPVIRHRHMALTEQFGHVADTRHGVGEWLKQHTIVRVTQKPLLPFIYEKLADSGCISQEYLETADRRMRQIADTMAVIAACHLPEQVALCQYLRDCRPAQRAFIRASLCGFDLTLFHDMGQDIRQLMENPDHQSSFLCFMPPVTPFREVRYMETV